MDICKIAFFCQYQYLGFIKSQQLFFMGFKIQFCFQILTLEIEKYRFEQKSENCIFGRQMLFLTKKYVFLDVFEAKKLIFPTKWVVFAPKQLVKFLTD